ncbi:hypothetical protein CBF27_01410 [Vagococcus acidifermentans]|uniref:FUSC family protein n=2 Tax=Vagococcus acidifermentans TaxID=564710 RepID=A0A430B2U8_9ENTE|nr:aromatic acid exporter family protein [Vagococcus acidifermentans]RSU14667.1 hypothetical protein CBF27_01410 [Vagococcus acidifermentans]
MKIGMRTFKTGVSVFLCILISIILNREAYIVAAITAVFTLREDMYNTIKYGRHRVVGNVFGAVGSLVVISLFKLFGSSNSVQLFVVPIVIVLIISLLSATDHHEGTVGACATLLTILFMIPEHQTYAYAINRVIDSFIGMGVALGVNSILPGRRTEQA